VGAVFNRDLLGLTNTLLMFHMRNIGVQSEQPNSKSDEEPEINQ